MSGNRSKSAFFEGWWVILNADFRVKGASPTNHSWYQSSRVIALLCGIKISAVRHLVLSQSTRVTDGQTDRQNYDSQDRPRICSRGKNWNNGNTGGPKENWCLGPSTGIACPLRRSRSAGGGRPLPLRGSGGITPGKFLRFYMQKILRSSAFLAGKLTISITHLPPFFGRSNKFTQSCFRQTGRSADDGQTDRPRYTYYISITTEDI